MSLVCMLYVVMSLVYVQLHSASLRLWAACERTSHANIRSNNGLWHRINTLDSNYKIYYVLYIIYFIYYKTYYKICLFNTMEFIQSQSYAGQVPRFQDFLNRDKSRSKVQKSGKLLNTQYPTRSVEGHDLRSVPI